MVKQVLDSPSAVGLFVQLPDPGNPLFKSIAGRKGKFVSVINRNLLNLKVNGRSVYVPVKTDVQGISVIEPKGGPLTTTCTSTVIFTGKPDLLPEAGDARKNQAEMITTIERTERAKLVPATANRRQRRGGQGMELAEGENQRSQHRHGGRHHQGDRRRPQETRRITRLKGPWEAPRPAVPSGRRAPLPRPQPAPPDRHRPVPDIGMRRRLRVEPMQRPWLLGNFATIDEPARASGRGRPRFKPRWTPWGGPPDAGRQGADAADEFGGEPSSTRSDSPR